MNKVKVLFVDDEHSLLKTYSLLLESDTSIIETCASEFEAIERLKLASFDICFLDYRMPELNGIQIREKVGDLGTKFYLITGELDFEDVPGFESVLMKPNFISEVESIIENYAKQKLLDT